MSDQGTGEHGAADGAADSVTDSGLALAAIFNGELAEGCPLAEADLEPLASTLARLLGDARATWPELSIDEADFVRAIARNLSPGRPWRDALTSVHAADLYLACSAAAGDDGAIHAIERLCFLELPTYLRAIDSAHGTADDALQNLRQRLFCGSQGGAPKLRQYTGRGSLRAFVRLSAVRELFSLRRKTGRETQMDDATLVELATSGTAELAAVKGQLREAFKRAFHSALASLTTRQRNLLRYHFMHGLSTRQTALLYRVHKATVARWIERARSDLRARTHATMAAELRAGGPEVDDLLRLVDTQLDVSLDRVLGTEPSLEK